MVTWYKAPPTKAYWTKVMSLGRLCFETKMERNLKKTVPSLKTNCESYMRHKQKSFKLGRWVMHLTSVNLFHAWIVINVASRKLKLVFKCMKNRWWLGFPQTHSGELEMPQTPSVLGRGAREEGCMYRPIVNRKAKASNICCIHSMFETNLSEINVKLVSTL